MHLSIHRVRCCGTTLSVRCLECRLRRSEPVSIAGFSFCARPACRGGRSTSAGQGRGSPERRFDSRRSFFHTRLPEAIHEGRVSMAWIDIPISHVAFGLFAGSSPGATVSVAPADLTLLRYKAITTDTV